MIEFDDEIIVVDSSVYLLERMEESEKYELACENLRNSPDIEIIINSPGGAVSIAMMLVAAMNANQNHKPRALITGQCHSSASLVALLAPGGCWATTGSYMCCHQVYLELNGSPQSINVETAFYKKWSKKLMNTAYKGFLTPVEIQSLLDGAEIWLDHDDINKRLTKRDKR